MVLDIKMCRFDNVPWGFRLIGGSDFELPLTVVKVTEGSIAEEAGLRVGDIIVRINDEATSPLTHEEAHNLILHCGNVFYFGIHREEEEEVNSLKHFPVSASENPDTPQSFLYAGSSCKSPSSIANSEGLGDEYLAELSDRPCSVMSEATEIKLVEEEIAAVMSGETEVLRDHNVMGIFPKPGVCMSSDVLRTLNEEAIKTKAEKDKEVKKWTTFLQKPNRPIPKSKSQIEAEIRAANAYKVQIARSAPPPKPKSPSPIKEPEPEPVIETIEETATENIADEEPPADSEVPNLEEIDGTSQKPVEEESALEETTSQNFAEANSIESECVAQNGDTAQEPNSNETECIVQEAETEQERTKTADEIALEQQLASVQQQLQALSTLPSTIQATLDAVTKQLGELLPTFRLQQIEQVPVNQENCTKDLHTISEEQTEVEGNAAEHATKLEENEDVEVKGGAHSAADNGKKDESANAPETRSNAVYDNDDFEVQSYEQQEHKDITESDDESSLKDGKKNKKQQQNVIMELEEHLERKTNSKKRSTRAFGPLTPSSERPLVLPGGRRWYRPKDAYNDEFIAETLSAQAELITGTTLGVNFMKYQKPEKKIDLNRSEVYKVIHHLDRQPIRGIEVRAPVVPAEADIRKAIEL